MTRPPILSVALLLTSLAACGPKEPAQSPEPSAEPPATSAAPQAEERAAPEAAKPEAAKPAPSREETPAESLARDLVKAGGRRIGYSASKKRFVLPMDVRTDAGRGLDLRFFDDEGTQREIVRVCQPGECEERLDEMFREMLPKLAGRLESEGYEPVSAIGWPSGRDEIDVSTLGARLHYEKGRLSMAVGTKPPAPLRPNGGKAPRAATLTAIYPIPAAKLIGVLAEGDFSVLKLP